MENIQKTFDYIDTDGSGGLSIGELRARLGEHVEEGYYRKLVSAFGGEKSGEVLSVRLRSAGRSSSA